MISENSSTEPCPAPEGKIRILFHGKLNDFLPSGCRNTRLEIGFNHKTAVKHIIESLGVPHPEVGSILANTQSVSLEYPVRDGDQIEVFPPGDPPDWGSQSNPAFVLDNHLGKLTSYLRFLGFDCLYDPEWDDDRLALIAASQQRILLTRDRGLLKRKIISKGYCLRADDPQDQVLEVVRQFHLQGLVKPFFRCARCNGILEAVDKSAIIDHLQPLTRKYYDEFTRCSQCQQIYWKGSHYDKIVALIRAITDQSTGATT